MFRSLVNLLSLNRLKLPAQNKLPFLLGLLCLSSLYLWSYLASHYRPAVSITPTSSLEGALLAADFAERENDLPAMIIYYQRAHKIQPANTDIMARLMDSYIELGEMAEAHAHAQNLMADYPHDEIVQTLLATQALRKNDWQEALLHAQMLPSKNAAGVLGFIIQLWAYDALGDTQAVEAVIEKLQQQEDYAAIGLRNLALFYEYKASIEEAEALYRQIGRQYGFPNIDHALDYVFFLHRYEFSQKRDTFFSAIGGQNPHHAVYRYVKPVLQSPMTDPVRVTPQKAVAQAMAAISALGVSYQTIQAMKYARFAHWLLPNERRVVMALAEALADNKDYDEAIALYEAMLQEPNQAPYYKDLITASIALLHEAKEETQRAIFLLETAKLDNQNFFLVKVLADMLRRQEAYEQAEINYNWLIEQLETVKAADWELFYGRGIVREQLGYWPAAERDLLKAVELSDNRPYVLNYLGYSWIDNGENVNQGLAMVEKAVQAEPNNGYFIDSLGWAFYRLGEFDKAVRLLEHAVMILPDEAEIMDHLGDALWQAGREYEARYHWQRTLTLDISDATREKILKKIDLGVYEEFSGEKPAL